MDLRGAYRPELSALGRFGVAWGATVAWLLISAVGLFGMTGGEADLDPVRIMVVPVTAPRTKAGAGASPWRGGLRRNHEWNTAQRFE